MPQITASPVQAQFIETVLMSACEAAPYRYLAYGGGIRGGKTFAVLQAAYALCKLFPGSRWAVVRKDLPTLRRTTLPSFYASRPQGFVGAVNQSTWTATCSNGSEIIFFSESIDIDPELNRWRGLEVNGFILEEANELSERSWAKAIERAGSWIVKDGAQPAPLILLTFNPSPNWVKDEFFDPWQQGALKAPYYFQPALIGDNPFIPDAYKDSLKNLPEAEYRRFVEGDWTTLSGRYFTDLDRAVHLIDPVEVKPYWEQWGGFDWGYQHPFAFGWFAKDTSGTIYLVDSVHGHKLLPDEQAERIVGLVGHVGQPALRAVYAGHDCWQVRRALGTEMPTVAEQFLTRGIHLGRAAIDRVPGWTAVRRAMAVRRDEEGNVTHPPLLYICDTPGNRRTLDALFAATMDPDRPEDVLKVDANPDSGRGGDDPCDMVRYGLATRIPLPKEPPKPVIDPDLRDLEPVIPASVERGDQGFPSQLGWGF